MGRSDGQQDGDVSDEAGRELVEKREEVGLCYEEGLEGGGVEGQGESCHVTCVQVS